MRSNETTIIHDLEQLKEDVAYVGYDDVPARRAAIERNCGGQNFEEFKAKLLKRIENLESVIKSQINVHKWQLQELKNYSTTVKKAEN